MNIPDRPRLLRRSHTDGHEKVINSGQAVNRDVGAENEDRHIMRKLIRASEIKKRDYQIDWVVEKLIPEHAIILFYAQGGTGKSTITTQIAAAIEKGKPIFGLKTLRRPVIILDFENPGAVIKERLVNIDDSDNIRFCISSDKPPRLDSPEWVQLKSVPEFYNNPVLIIDTLGGATPNCDISSNKDYAEVMKQLVEIRDLGATIILLHHSPKADRKKYMGASTIFNQCDHVLAMWPNSQQSKDSEFENESDGIFRLGTAQKTRFGHYELYVEFDADSGAFVIADEPDKGMLQRLKEILVLNGPLNQTQIIDLVKGTTLEKHARQLLKKGVGNFWNEEKGPHNSRIYHLI